MDDSGDALANHDVTATDEEAQTTPTAGLAHGQLCYLQIPALDVTASARFYQRVFGWRVDPPGAEFRAPALIGQWITDRVPSPDAGPIGWIFVHDVEATLAEATQAGATDGNAPVPDGPRRLASFRDPAGNLVGVADHHGKLMAGPTSVAGVANRSMPSCTVIPELVYDDVTAAVRWLVETFGFSVRWVAGDHRAQLSLGDSTIVVTEPRTSKALAGPQSLMVRVPDAATHLVHVRSRGATIVDDLRDFPYGERQYSVEDLGGHHWTFSQSIADLPPEDWGGTSGPALQRRVAGLAN